MRAVLAVCVLLVGAALAASSSGSNPPKPFKGAQSYVYRFDTQVSTALVGASPSEIQQSSATRLRGDVQLSFSNDRHAKLRLQNVRIGELNGELPKSQRVQPLEHFERKTVPEEIRQKLELPLSVSLVDGVVERINFHEDDSTWSKNIKRAVLNMIQLNLKRNDVQGLKLQSSMPATQAGSEGKNAPMFTVPEITLEGECEVVYSVQKNAKYGSEEDEQAPFNVTKTVNFKKCERTADLSMGYQANPAEQLRCLNCIRKQKPAPNALETEQIKQAGCQLECQPSKINEDKDVDRSTYVRFELLGQQQRYALKKSSMISQYIVKAQNPEAQNTVIQVVALTELTFKDQEQGDKMVPSFKQSSTDETLMYNAEWDIKAKRFFMFGDEEPSPYARAQKKEQKAAHALKKIIEQWQNQQGQGYELDSALKFSQLVTVLRQSTVKEIKSIEQTIKSMAQEQQQGQQHAVEQAMSIFQDALATAATRNTLFIVAEKIMKQEDQCTPAKAIKLIQIFTANQHSPSERQAELLERIAKSEVAHRHPALKQTAWLSFAQAVGAICQDKPAESQKSHFRVEEICPRGKKEQFKKTLLEQWKKAETIYEQVLALKMIGNAALDNSIEELTQIVKDKQQPTLVRIEAIDAMRRLRTSMPQKIRQTLLPIFQNQREEPEIRMTAFSMIVYTHPDKAIVDQIIFSVIFDRSSSLKSFVLSAAESFSKSPSSAEQEIATHLKAALKMIKLQPEQMRASRKYRVPIYVSAQENTEEQRIFLGLASIVSPANMIPIHLSASLRSAFNGEATEENFQLSFSQKNLEEWYSRVVDYAREYSSSGERDQMERRGAKDLRSIYSSLGIKNRRTGSYYLESDEQQQQDSEEQSSRTGRKISQNKPFGMIVIRTNDVDQAVLPVSDEQLPQVVRKIMSGEKPSLMSELNNELISQLAAGKHFQNHVGLNMLEKRTRIPTTSGLPVELTRKFAAVGSVSGELKARFESDAIESSRGLTAELKMRTSAIVSHVQKAQVWSPVLVNGVESVRTVEITLPINVRVRADAQKVELKVRLPEEKKVRVLALHTLPMTYTRHFDMQTQTYREPRVKSIHNWALEHTQTEQHASQQQGNWIIVSGHFHRVKSGKQLVHALYTTENNVHIYYQPSERTPKELILRASGSAFQKHATHSRPELDSFYSSGKSFKHIYPEDFEGMDLEQDEQRTSKLNSYSQKYAPSNAYKHELKLEAEARCGQKTHKAMADLKAGCDSRLKHCKIFIEAERTPIHGESQQWRMKTKVQTVAPELINDDEEPSAKQSRMLVQIESQWGSDRQSSMNVRLQAEPTKKTYWNKDTSDKWSRFLNKIDLVAEYSMPKSQQNSIQRLYELAKAQYFWQLSAEERQNQDGMIHATIVVDPISRRYANVSIQTPQERIRLEGIELPVRMAQYTLNRRPSNIQSMSQLFEHATSYGGASCRADDRKVQTFDGVRYKAPMSNGCWHVLAKDCSREEPRFVVLMKKQQSGEEKRLVKIVTPDSTIELQAKPSSQGTPIVKINGEQMSGEEKLAEEGVETSYGQVIVKKAGIKVEFNGQKVNVKVPQMYKNLQCGLCGHYNDEEEDVFRTASNELSSSLKEFHKSYTLKNEECSNVDKFYNEQESSEFAIRPQSGRKSQRKSQQGSSWFDSEEQQQSQEQSSSSRHRQSNFDSSEEEEGKWQTSQERKTGKRSPVERTQVIEYQHRVCFSEAVKKCPKGTQVDDEAQTKNAKVRFFCKERGSVEARRLLRKVRRGELVDVEAQQLQASFVEDIEVPTRCAVAAY